MTNSRRLALTLAAAAWLVAGGCGTANDGASASSTTTTTEAPSTTTTTAPPGPLSDQTPPASTFGLWFDGNKVWVADFFGGQVLAVDPDSGSIVKRYKGDDGVSDEVNDVTVGPDGSVYWTGFNDGAIGRMNPNDVGVVIGRLDTGADGIAFSPDGKRLFAGRSVIGDGIWEIDPAAHRDKRLVAGSPGNINSFAVTNDGIIYGPRWGVDGAGALVRIDSNKEITPGNAEITEVAKGFSGPIAVKLSPNGDQAYVLSLPPGGKPKLDAVDLATHAVTPLPDPKTALVDNLAVAPDGRIFVSSFNEAKLTVIRPDGTAQLRPIGHR